ncbi:TNF receptor-associated factor 1 isoform X1 [Marmota marmota marmota]|uniref:TNF receptor-associated factor 1 isoform X1 n=1 Tax=Marmota marmota marmota TaxID=9994 RepID=UPI0007623E08|nr:TNF receptor-associated factor 1 isoform X1 [Marmota marmota marmota]XP_015353152.1 TNF receptor-associated factor 1 isoform X1 [Marmota marmota marmota]XP_015353154.1 TNF receptor-associated factor 1 isoform X1 [Marmota marmota marmota]XP_015353155.1 TNF receptor-associated factor 1 isoform X1 [Marmota marmota marmota]XP_027800825.1 TNF receptor-associated factor 1 isoform X1 [Marmota flaviventris]XP_027800833.1 TNF receptor-associated factor 1 isoform X1 [Marmota flaviventris]XP_02780084
MASNSASSPHQAPDENEFPFGCPRTVCQDPPEPRALCCTACLSENLRNSPDGICPKCRGDNLQSESPRSLLTQEKVHPEVAKAGVGCPFAAIGCSFKGSPQAVQEHEASSYASHLSLLLGFMKHCKAQLGPGLGSGPMALEQNLSDLQLQAAVEVAGDLEVDCYRAPCSESQEELALQHFLKEKLLAELEEKLRVFENIVAVLNKEVEASHLALAASLHQSQLDREHILSLEQRVVELQQTLAQKDQALGKLEQSLRLMEEASYDGTFLWKITNVARRCHESACGRTISLFSPAFYTAKYGYKLCLRLYLNGDGTGKRTHLSLFIVIMRGEYDALLSWPFRNKVTFMLLDQNNREHAIDAFRPDLSSASFQRPQSETNVASGCPLFFPLNRLHSPKHAYVKDDTMFLKCIVETSA